jgi:hypothetical protein
MNLKLNLHKEKPKSLSVIFLFQVNYENFFSKNIFKSSGIPIQNLKLGSASRKMELESRTEVKRHVYYWRPIEWGINFLKRCESDLKYKLKYNYYHLYNNYITQKQSKPYFKVKACIK